MLRRDWMVLGLTSVAGASASAQMRLSQAELEAGRRSAQREYHYREWLCNTGFAAFFGDARGPYARVDYQPRNGRLLLSDQAKQAFQVPYDPVELESGHVVLGAHQKGFAPLRCYAVLQGWSSQLVAVALLHNYAGRTQAERQMELEAAMAASAAMKGAVPPRTPYTPRYDDPSPTLTLFTRAQQPVQALLMPPVVRVVRDQINVDLLQLAAMERQEAAAGRNVSRLGRTVTTFKTEHREL